MKTTVDTKATTNEGSARYSEARETFKELSERELHEELTVLVEWRRSSTGQYERSGVSNDGNR